MAEAEGKKETSAQSEEDIEALLESCEKLLVTDDKASKEADSNEANSETAATSEEEKVQNEIKKSLEAFGKLGAELGGDFNLDFHKEFAKVLAEGGDPSLGDPKAALEGLPDLMNALQMVASEVESSGEGSSNFLNAVSANFLSACSDLQANLPKPSGSHEEGDNSALQEEELDQLQNRMQIMLAMFSKDIFKPALTEMGEKYPKWLEENRPKLSDSDVHRYEQQYEIVKSILVHLNKEDVTNEQEHMMKFATLLEKMQSYGLPPEGLLDNEPLANIDTSAAFDQCSLM